MTSLSRNHLSSAEAAEADRALELFERESEREEAIEQVAHQLRIRREAELRLNKHPHPTLPDETLADALARPPVLPAERVADLLPAGGNALLVAEKMAGKTTLALNLAASLADGKPFLGFKVEPLNGRVAFLNYEMSEWQLTQWLRDMEVERPDRIVPLNLRGQMTPFQDERFRDKLVEWLMRWNVKIMLIDPVARAWRGMVDDENNNSQVGEFTSVIDEISREAGISEAFLCHHQGRKQHEEGKEHGRGATRLEDWPDSLWYLTKDKSKRSLRAIGRDVDVEAFDLGYDPSSRRLSASGQTRANRKQDEDALDATRAVARAGEPLSAGDLDKAMEITNKGQQLAARKAAVKKGWLVVGEAAHGGTPYELTEAGKEASQTS